MFKREEAVLDPKVRRKTPSESGSWRTAASGESNEERRPQDECIEAKIREIAYDLYIKRGCQSGQEIEDWLKAEEIAKTKE